MKRITELGASLRPQLDALIKDMADNLDDSTLWGRDFLERLLPFATSGKMLRGGLVCFAYESFGGHIPDRLVTKAALALELTHSALLIHDDIMDHDDVRRGQPTLHRQYQQLGDKKGLPDSERFGVSMAICSGDAALFLAFELLAEVAAESRVTESVSQLFVKQLTRVCAGQMQDIYFDSMPGVPTKKDIYELMAAKTASYTLALPLAMGAALAGQGASTIRQLEAAGEAAGMIYQIRDDELGLLGDAKAIGKPVGSDIREGKKTLLYYYLMKRSSASDRQKLSKLFGNPDLDQSGTATARQLIYDYKIPEVLALEVKHLTNQANKAIEALNADVAVKDELKELVAFCGRRQY